MPSRPAKERLLSGIFIGSGFVSAAVLLINGAEHAGLLPRSTATQLIAPVAQIAAIGLVVGLAVAARSLRGPVGAIGSSLYVAALAGLVGVEFVLNMVFPYVDAATIDHLRAGPLGIAFVVVSFSFLLATLLYYGAFWREPGSPKAAIVLAVVGTIPIALRNLFPDVALHIGIATLAVAVAWMAVWLLQRCRISPAE